MSRKSSRGAGSTGTEYNMKHEFEVNTAADKCFRSRRRFSGITYAIRRKDNSLYLATFADNIHQYYDHPGTPLTFPSSGDAAFALELNRDRFNPQDFEIIKVHFKMVAEFGE